MPQAPVGLRAQTLKAEIRDLENLRHKLEERESLIKVNSKIINYFSQINNYFFLMLLGDQSIVEKQTRRIKRDERA